MNWMNILSLHIHCWEKLFFFLNQFHEKGSPQMERGYVLTTWISFWNYLFFRILEGRLKNKAQTSDFSDFLSSFIQQPKDRKPELSKMYKQLSINTN